MGLITTKVKLQLAMEAIGAFIFAPFRWVGDWTERRRTAIFAQQLALARVQAEAQREMFTSMMGSMETMVREMGETSRQQAQILQEWLKGFRTAEAPSSSVVTEEQEAQAERARLLAAHGFPVDAAAAEQARWLFDKMDEV